MDPSGEVVGKPPGLCLLGSALLQDWVCCHPSDVPCQTPPPSDRVCPNVPKGEQRCVPWDRVVTQRGRVPPRHRALCGFVPGLMEESRDAACCHQQG